MATLQLRIMANMKTTKRLQRIRKAQFDFSKRYKWTAFWTCPFFFVRKNLYKNIRELAPELKGSILDFGCGAKPYQDLFVNSTKYVGLDIEVSGHDHTSESIDVYYDGKTIPFGDESFDNIFSSEVYEHVPNLDGIMDELHRVLKQGGYMLATAPFVWNEHEIPYDFTRYTSFGIRALLEKHGFEIVDYRKSTSCLEMVYQMKAEYYRYQFQNVKSPMVRHAIQRTLISFQTLKGLILSKILPVNWSFYGDNIILCRKKGPATL